MIDARVRAPSHAITLTTRDPNTPGKVYREASAHVWRTLRRHGYQPEYFGAIEWTSGRAARSGGHRRMHGHYLVKGLEGEDVRLVEHHVRSAWKAATEGRGHGAWVVEVAELVVPGAAIHYLNLHHRKAEQAPPDEWRGMIERASRGYWTQPIAELRELARLELRAEALHWAGVKTMEEATFLAEQDAAAKAAERQNWRDAREALRQHRLDSLRDSGY